MIKEIYKIIAPCFKEDKTLKWYLSGIIFTLCVAIFLSIANSYSQARLFNALESKNLSRIYYSLGFLMCLITIFILNVSEKFYFKKMFALKVRQALYNRYGVAVLTDEHCAVPCQRMSQDLHQFSSYTIELFASAFFAIVEIPVFVAILYNVTDWKTAIGAVLYAIFGTYVTKKIAKPIIQLDYALESREGQLRRQLIANIQAETNKQLPEIGEIITMHQNLIKTELKLTYFQSFYDRIGGILPYFFMISSYVSGKITFGALMQSSSGFGRILECLSFFVHNREGIVGLKATVMRINELSSHIKQNNA